MAPGRAADVNQDSACCRADSEPAGSARPDDVKLMYMYGGEKGEGNSLSHVKRRWMVGNLSKWSHTSSPTVSDRHHTPSHAVL